MGATASGKTELAINLSERFAMDIISVDAAQVYRGMDIGTAKPCPEILKRYPHKLIDILDPAKRYSAGRFRQDAMREISLSHERGRIPLLAGGTMFYFKALSDGLSNLPRASVPIGEQIQQMAANEGWPAVHAKLAEVDSDIAAAISPNDAQRIQRMLEIYIAEGRSASEVMGQSPPAPMPYEQIKLAVVSGDRTDLRTRIAVRFRSMVDRGFLEEARALYDRADLDLSLPSMKSAGYQEAWRFFDGQIDFETMLERAIRSTGSIAKRQLTWLRNASGVVWVDNGSNYALDLMTKYLRQVIPSA